MKKQETITFNTFLPCTIKDGHIKGKNKEQTTLFELMVGNGNYPVKVEGKKGMIFGYYVDSKDIIGTTKKPAEIK